VVAPGAIFVARYIDDNNKENGDPIHYVGTTVVQRENNARFIDKPWLAVDIPRGGSTCRVNGNTFAAGNVYVVYTVFNGTGAAAAALGDRDDDDDAVDPDRDRGGKDGDHDKDDRNKKAKELHGKIMFSRSTDCGVTWSAPDRLSAPNDINQGATIAIHPVTGDVYVVWRQFADAASNTGNELLAVRSRDGGKHFDKPVRIAAITPFDQGTTSTSFRTNAYPTMTIDETGRAYVAWSSRGFAPVRPDPVSGDGRIVLSTSSNGTQWTQPQPIDNVSDVPGHQIMPALAYAAGKLQIAFYDLREDVSHVFGPFIDDANQPIRHTIDLRTAQASPGPQPQFASYSVIDPRPSNLVSDYLRGSLPGFAGLGNIRQLEFNPPNLPLFKQGTAPFLGDYIDLAPAPAFVPTANGGWAFNTSRSNQPLFHVAWTDNRDVRPPLDNNWAHYTPPTYIGPLSDAANAPVCIVGQTGMRNQNVYTSLIGPELVAGSPGNTKPLSSTLQRGFVVYAQNATTRTRSYQLTIGNQPPGGRASFSQFPLPPTAAAPLLTVYVTVPALSMTARTVYITSTDPKARVDVLIAEVAAPGQPPIPGGAQATVELNPDITNPDITNPDITNPDITNPDITNPDITNPDITNTRVMNPDITNGTAPNPDITNPDITNTDIANPDITNPDITNGSMTDYTWTVTNDGNTAAGYATTLFSASAGVPSSIKLQLVVTKTYTTPTAIGCDVKALQQHVLVTNVVDPTIATPGTVSTDPNADPSNAAFWLAPGETAKITLRVVDTDKTDTTTFNVVDTVFAAIKPQEVSTPLADQGVTTSPIVLPPSAASLAFAIQPGEAVSGQPLLPAVAVRAVDFTGAPAVGIDVTLALEPNSSGATLGGTLTAKTNAIGIATFDNVRISGTGTGLRLRASAPARTPLTSASFTSTGLNTAACTMPMFTPTYSQTLTFPVGLAVADFNGDGLPDVALTEGNFITVYLQGPIGVFSPLAHMPLGAPGNLAAADMDGDGAPDLVVADRSTQSFRVLKNTGGGSFTPLAPFSIAGGAGRFVLADANNDGSLDVAVASTTGDGFVIVLNNGDGTFTASHAIALGTQVAGIAAGDFNGDGNVDFAATSGVAGNVYVLTGDGHGSAALAQTIALAGQPSDIVVGDFDDNGSLDLAVVTAGDHAAHVLLGSGAAHFTAGVSVPVGAGSTGLVARDFDSDGHLDLVVSAAGGLTIVKGDGFGGLTVQATDVPFGGGITAIASLDLNGDTRSDLVVALSSRQIGALLNACGSVSF